MGHLALIEKIERATSSVNGNPAWILTLVEDGETVTRRTSSDAAVGYEIGNPGYRAGCTVEVTTTKAGRITYLNAVNA